MLTAALAWRVGPRFVAVYGDPRPVVIRRAVQTGVLSLVLLDAALSAAYAGPVYAAIVLATALLGAACRSGNAGHAPLPMADLRTGDCVPLGEVSGFGVGGSHVSRDMQLDWARSDVLARAAELGATHVVFVSERVEPARLTLEGVAYRCR